MANEDKKYEKKLIAKAQYLDNIGDAVKKKSIIIGNAYVYPTHIAIKINSLPVKFTGWIYLNEIEYKQKEESKGINQEEIIHEGEVEGVPF